MLKMSRDGLMTTVQLSSKAREPWTRTACRAKSVNTVLLRTPLTRSDACIIRLGAVPLRDHHKPWYWEGKEVITLLKEPWFQSPPTLLEICQFACPDWLYWSLICSWFKGNWGK